MSVDTTSRPLYRFTLLGTALVKMWRAWAVIVPVVLVNALVQALLVLPNVNPGLSPAFILLALVSLIVLIVAFGIVAAALLLASTGRTTPREAIERARARLLPLLAWSIGLLVVALIGLMAFVIPGLVVLALTPFLLLAVLDGKASPLAVNFRTIGARWGRWLVTVIVMGIVSFIVWLLSALDGFFVTGAPGALIGWILIGFVASWFTCAWALLYRTVND